MIIFITHKIKNLNKTNYILEIKNKGINKINYENNKI